MTLFDLALRTGRSPIQLLLNAVLLQMEADVARDTHATRLQAAWRAFAVRKRYLRLKTALADISGATQRDAAELGTPSQSARAVVELAAQLAATEPLVKSSLRV